MIASKRYGNVAEAARGLDAFMSEASYNNKKRTILDEGGLCDQEGCAEEATRIYKLAKTFCHCGAASDPYAFGRSRPHVRQFCAAHSRRGDCALEDTDSNYEVLEGDGPQAPLADALSPSVFGGIVTADGIVGGVLGDDDDDDDDDSD